MNDLSVGASSVFSGISRKVKWICRRNHIGMQTVRQYSCLVSLYTDKLKPCPRPRANHPAFCFSESTMIFRTRITNTLLHIWKLFTACTLCFKTKMTLGSKVWDTHKLFLSFTVLLVCFLVCHRTFRSISHYENIWPQLLVPFYYCTEL